MEVDHPPRHQQRLVYEPQSVATPVKSSAEEPPVDALSVVAAGNLEAATATASSSAVAVESRRRKRRSFFGGSKNSPVPAKSAKRKSIANQNSAGLLPSERRACLTEILWEDVQKAKELLGFRQKAAAAAAAADAVLIPVQCPQVPTPPPMQSHPVIARIMSQPHTSASASMMMHHHPHPHHHYHTHQNQRYAPIAILEEVENQPRSTASLPGRRSHRHRRASSDLAASSTPATTASEGTTSSPDSGLITAGQPHPQQQLPQQQQQLQKQHLEQQHQRRVARFWELKRLLMELTERKAEKLRQLTMLEAKEKTLSGDFGCSTIGKLGSDTFISHHSSHHSLEGTISSLHQQQQQHAASVAESQLCFPTQYLVAFEHKETQSELLQLQEEAAVQRALVEANARLVRECQTDKATRQFKRKRAQEYQRAQEKLRALNQRIAEILARDSAASFASSLCGGGGNQTTVAAATTTDCKSASSEAVATTNDATAPGPTAPWSQSLSLPALRRQQLVLSQHPMRMQHSFRLRPPHQLPAAAVSHAGSIDSGFQELPSDTILSSSTSCFAASSSSTSSASSLVNNIGHPACQTSAQSLHFRPIDDDEDDNSSNNGDKVDPGNSKQHPENDEEEDMSGVF